MQSIAFPAISTGIHGYPTGPSAEIAIAVVRCFQATRPAPETVIFACSDAATLEIYRSLLGSAEAAL